MKDNKKDELSSTGAVAPLNTPMGITKKKPDDWDEETIEEIKENIIKNIKKLS